MTGQLRNFFASIGRLERALLALSVIATLVMAWSLYGASFKREDGPRSPDLYWMVVQMQLALNKVDTDVWRYQSGQISREALERSYAIAISKYRMYSSPSLANSTLRRVESFDQVKEGLEAFFSKPPRQWTLAEARQVTTDIAALRQLLADFGTQARYQENSEAVQRLNTINEQHQRYVLILCGWMGFLVVFWFVLHRVGVIRAHAMQQRQVLEREQAARAALVQSELARDTFLATISHEIRSPLQSIQTCVELLEFSLPPGRPGHDYLQRLKHSCEHLLVQVRDIMDVAALKNYQLTLEPCATDIPALVDAVAQAHAGLAEAKSLRLDVACATMPQLWLDGHRLRQVIWNLVSNAIRYTDHGGVSLRVAYQPRLLTISVQDSGVGIPDDMKPQLFRPFARGKSRRPGSSGLGLAIVHELVSLFGGAIQVESREGVGSCFQVQLPVQERNEPDEGEPYALPVGRILLLDDDDHIRESYRALLEVNGYQVETIDNVPDGIAKVKGQAYDLLLLDLQVGDASGYEVAEAANRSVSNRETPIIGMTAFRQEFGDARQALLAGQLEKPFNYLQLQRLLRRYLPRPPQVLPSA
ncbi:hypothetical protein CEK28_18240 [Xenophilus sp. AP218F]|nr:hypothetical protein CEK28_18240 [Xenophilus sp. AP218F]